MHELSLAQSIVDIIRQQLPDQEHHALRTVRLRVGTMSGVVTDSLDFCFHAITAGTPLEQSALAAEEVPFTLQCESCGAVTTNDTGTLRCASCGSTTTHITAGRELQVVSLELEETP